MTPRARVWAMIARAGCAHGGAEPGQHGGPRCDARTVLLASGDRVEARVGEAIDVLVEQRPRVSPVR